MPWSSLHAFEPAAVLFALDAPHLLAGIEIGQDAAEVKRRLLQIGSENGNNCRCISTRTW
jgi:hypothetical protein